ncbi:uncharacterized protein LOC119354460 [Triticum dicoccoides]|uniref:uncharacterized protein LOC119354460 n=1 Tax=Triticum dicoccoides TaxID=85692 RepID=UPI00188FE2CE|nr:uncharacterized protein LOC119354460 [Triticum dicoccoides]
MEVVQWGGWIFPFWRLVLAAPREGAGSGRRMLQCDVELVPASGGSQVVGPWAVAGLPWPSSSAGAVGVAAAKKKRKMTDLNELPPDLNEIPHDVDQQQPSVPPGANADYETENGRSVYYTQITRVPNPIGHDNVAGQSSTRGAPIAVSLQSENHTLDDTSTAANVPCPTRTELGAGVVDGVVQGEEREDEAGSQPMEPYTGMRFGSLQIAKDHYNKYALRMGFSVKINTSRRTARTNVLVKQRFCCNKYKK